LNLTEIVRSTPKVFKLFIDRLKLSTLQLSRIPKPQIAIIFALVTLTLVIPTFNQGDLNHTVVSSYGFLKGHFVDFYDFNKQIVGGNDYLPVLYIIFATWMAPYYFLGLPVASSDGGIALFPLEIIWAKLLLIFVFALSVLLVSRIARLIHPNNVSRQALATWAFALSPFAIFAFGIFSQYDILGVFFTLWAFYMLLQKKMTKFAILIGIALTFKFFAALLVLPLMLLGSKKFFELIKLGLIASAPLLLQLSAFWSNDAFRNQIFSLVSGKAGGAATSYWTYVAVAVYLLMCLAAWLSDRWRGSFEQKAVLFTLASYGLMFLIVIWHPQWLIILTPFLALMVSMISFARTWILWESVAFFAFVGFVVSYWKYNVDGLMIERGALANLFPNPKLLISDFVPGEIISTILAILGTFFLAPPILLLIQIFRNNISQERVGEFSWFSRVAISWIAFIIPAFVAVYIPMDLAVKINRNAALTVMQKEVLSDISQIPVAEISKEVKVTQSFMASADNLSGIGMQLATYGRINSSFVLFEIRDQSRAIIHSEKVEANTIQDNAWFAMTFQPVSNSSGKTYEVSISSGSQPGLAITAYSSIEDTIPSGDLKVNGEIQSGDLSLAVYFTPAP